MGDEHEHPTISNDRAARAPDTTDTYRHQLMENSQHETPSPQESSLGDTPEVREFLIEEIVRHIVTGPRTKYVVGWY